jgi:hypothetical protein
MIVCPVAGLAYHRAVVTGEYRNGALSGLVAPYGTLWREVHRDTHGPGKLGEPVLAFRFVTNSLQVTNAGGASSISCRPKLRG